MDLKAFAKKLDRALFVEDEYKRYAYDDCALPIGFEQTISQPSLVLKMTCMLELAPDKSSKVLEIGTGSGYQTALLAEFSDSVYTVEKIKELSEKAEKRLGKLGYKNIKYKIGDGSEGWIENSPYDRIIVTAAASKVPTELTNQLKAGGRMVIPVGPRNVQELLLITKDKEGQIHIHSDVNVVFVELRGKYGWTEKNQGDRFNGL